MQDDGFRYMIRSESGTLAYVGRTGMKLSASLIKFDNLNGALRVARRLELRTKRKHFVYPVSCGTRQDEDKGDVGGKKTPSQKKAKGSKTIVKESKAEDLMQEVSEIGSPPTEHEVEMRRKSLEFFEKRDAEVSGAS